MRIRWTPLAAENLSVICDYTKEHDSPAAARRVALRIYERVALLSRFPNLGRPGRKPGTRELVLSGLPFVAVYRVREDAIEVIRILHGAQQWP